MNFRLLGFLFKSVMMGMIAALFLFVFFPHLINPVAPEKQEEEVINVSHLSFSEAIKKVSPSVVNIRTLFPERESINSQPTAKIGMGSGVIISPQGYIVTNYHVVSQASEIAVELTDGRRTIAHIVGSDIETDLAILQISMENLPYIVMDSNVKAEVGDVALAIGHPFGVGQSVTMGVVSATGRSFLGLSEYEDYIQTDAAVNQGNSGGALINSKGELLGISSATFRYSTKTGISFAISNSLALDVIEQIITNGRVIRGWLGFNGGPVNKLGREKFGKNAYLIEGIAPNGPADIAGVKENDILLSVNGKSIDSVKSLHAIIAKSELGSEIVLEVNRNDEILRFNVIVQERPQPVAG